MTPLFTVIFVSKLVSVEMACLLVIQNEIQALCVRVTLILEILDYQKAYQTT